MEDSHMNTDTLRHIVLKRLTIATWTDTVKVQATINTHAILPALSIQEARPWIPTRIRRGSSISASSS